MIATVFRDALLLMLCVMALCIASLLFFLSDPTKTHNDGSMGAPGSLVVSLSWDTGDDDLDLWLAAPGDQNVVYYKNRGGKVWNLLRDDLGDKGDLTKLNYENAFSRGEPAGKYVINVICYRCKDVMPVHAQVQVQEQAPDGSLINVGLTNLTFTHDGQQETGMNFEVGANNKVIRDSISTVFVDLVRNNIMSTAEGVASQW